MTRICPAARSCVAGSFCSDTILGGGSYGRLRPVASLAADEEPSLRPRSSGRSAGSMCLCVVEAVLSTIVFLHIMGKTANGNIGDDGVLVLPLVIGCTAFAVWIGASRSLCTLRVQRAVDKLRSTDNEATNRRLGRDRPTESLDVDNGVDVFEYHDITTMSLYFLRGVMVWLLVLLFVTALSVVHLFLYVSTCQSWSWFTCQSLPWYFPPLLCAVALLWTGCFTQCLYRRSTVGAIRTFGEPCRTKTFYLHAWKYLLAGSLLYAALLYVSPAPPVWRWALIATHSMRAVKVLVSLHGQRCNAVEEGGEVAEDML